MQTWRGDPTELKILLYFNTCSTNNFHSKWSWRGTIITVFLGLATKLHNEEADKTRVELNPVVNEPQYPAAKCDTMLLGEKRQWFAKSSAVPRKFGHQNKFLSFHNQVGMAVYSSQECGRDIPHSVQKGVLSSMVQPFLTLRTMQLSHVLA